MRVQSRLLSLLLIPLIVFLPASAQSPTPAPPEPDSQALQLRVVEDSGATSVNSTTEKGFTVQVTDASGAPVSDAAVAFRLPDHVPTGAFADSSHARVVYSDSSGHATFSGIHWGETPGNIEIRITAAKGIAHTGLLIQQALAADAVSPSPVPVNAVAPPPPPGVLAKPPSDPPEIARAQSGASLEPAGAAFPTVETPIARPPIQQAKTEQAKTEQPKITITNAPTGAGGPSSSAKKKWIILALVGAGLGVGAAMAFAGHGAAVSSSTSTALVIGSPTISVGH